MPSLRPDSTLRAHNGMTSVSETGRKWARLTFAMPSEDGRRGDTIPSRLRTNAVIVCSRLAYNKRYVRLVEKITEEEALDERVG